MERLMIVATTFDEFRRRVLAPEGLDDPSKFLTADFFDEIPLYSRYEQIEPFLRYGRSAGKILLDLALEYLAETVPGEMRAFISYPDMLDQMTCVGVPKDQCAPRS